MSAPQFTPCGKARQKKFCVIPLYHLLHNQVDSGEIQIIGELQGQHEFFNDLLACRGEKMVSL
ncbi:MAG: hypothetical protein V2I36_02505 [Desulfopila sp.]|nr:hypothetical protein [Desulfopila sp.]